MTEEQRAGDESLHQRDELLDQEGRLVAPDDLVLAGNAGFDLVVKADGQGAAVRQLLVLLHSNSLSEGTCLLLRLVRGWVGILLAHLLIDVRLLVLCPESIGRSREGLLVSVLDQPFGRHETAGQIVADVGALATNKAQALHEWLSFV